jgi:hypothetical protein
VTPPPLSFGLLIKRKKKSTDAKFSPLTCHDVLACPPGELTWKEGRDELFESAQKFEPFLQQSGTEIAHLIDRWITSITVVW